MKKNYKIAVAGTGYVGLSIATLLSQHHQVTAVDIIPEKVLVWSLPINVVTMPTPNFLLARITCFRCSTAALLFSLSAAITFG